MATRNTARNSAGALLLALSLTGMIRAAYADCTTVESVVTCAGISAGGFIAGAGVTGLTVNVASGTLSQGLPAANTSVSLRVNNLSSVTNSGLISNTGGTGTGTGGGNGNIGVWLMGTDTSFTNTNSGNVTVSISEGDIVGTPDKYRRTVTGVLTTVDNSASTSAPYQITNNGTIAVAHAGAGPVRGIFAGGATSKINLDNAGIISVERSKSLNLTLTTTPPATAGTPQATPDIPGVTVTPLNLALAAAVDSEEEVADMTIHNHAGGIISATGQTDHLGTTSIAGGIVVGIYGRAGELTIINQGTITSSSIAIAQVDGGGDDDDGPVGAGGGETELTNTGTINGDILFVDANPLRYWLSEAKGITLNLANQTGVRASEVNNSGTINGNFYLGSGEHVITNSGRIDGSIFVNQTEINLGILGEREFVLTNSGVITGNIGIRDTDGATNTITLINGGFEGSISAATGAGNNTLNLLGTGTLPSVTKFSTLNVGFAPAAEEEEEDEGGGGDDDDDEAAPPAKSKWTIAAGHEVAFGETNIGNGGILIVNGELESGEINVLANGTLEVNGEVESEEINVLAGGVLMGSGVIEAEEVTIRSGGMIDLRTTTLTVHGSVELKSGAILRTTLYGPGGATPDTASTNAGQLVVTVTGEGNAGAKVVPVSASGVVKTGDWYRVAHNSSGGAVFDTLPGVQNSALISWQIRENTEQDIVIGATVKDIASIPGITPGAASALNSLLTASSDNAKLNALIGEVQGLQTEGQLRKAGDQLRPEANGAQSTIALTINDRVQAVIDQRIAQTNLAYFGSSGVSTGEGGSGRAGWVQGFGFYGQQDQSDGVDGYTASTGGIALGGDTLIGSGDATRVGIALSYASSKIDGDGTNSGDSTKIDSYQATLYGSYAMPTWYVNGALGLGLHQYDGRRVVTVGAIQDIATSNHDGTQYSARVEAGLPLQFGRNTLIPVASVAYSHLDQEAYAESSSAGTALAIEQVKTDSTRTGLGARMLFDLSEPDTRTAVELRAIWLHEFGDVAQDTTARFAAGGASFTTSGVGIGRDSVNLGIGMRFSSANSRQQVLISYDAEIRDQYIGHTAMLQARQEF